MGVASGCGYQEVGVASGSGWNVWVWLSGGGCGWQEAGVASGWNLWVWLSGGGCGYKEVGVVGGCFPHLTYISLLHLYLLFFAATSLLLFSFC